MNNGVSLYIHIPYCKSKCAYCDFCSSYDATTAVAYTAELMRRIKARSGLAKAPVTSVYFGGGTPTVIGAEALCDIIGVIKSNYELEKDCEITLETNPATVNEADLSDLRLAGFNRLSAGLQTSNEKELAALGRTSHTVSDGAALVTAARRAGFDNINLDLMYGIPGQTLASFEQSMDFVVSLCPEHVSAYALKLEEGTPLYKRRDTLDLPDDDTVADMYLLLNRKLEEKGYNRYEISNFSKPGFESRHNLRYWDGGDYLGFGVSAASLYNNVRYMQSRDMNAFLQGEGPDTVEKLDGKDLLIEYIMLHLRLRGGIDKKDFKKRFGRDFGAAYEDKIKKYTGLGLAADTEDAFYLTERGVLVSNSVICDLIY